MISQHVELACWKNFFQNQNTKEQLVKEISYERSLQYKIGINKIDINTEEKTVQKNNWIKFLIARTVSVKLIDLIN